MKRLLFALCLLPVAASAEEKAPPPPPSMSCDDQIINTQLKIQTVVDYDRKSAGQAHVRAAQDAIARNDPETCKAEVAKAMAVLG